MNKADKENKEKQDKYQAILSALLKDDDNKYCVDCDAKGPRWASWNLGVFLCIRCAGIHRNLGVHISKVKSVTLDAWSSEQVAMMQDMGNSRARAVYEANIPDNFRRPQTDSSLEAFIRSKYEQKKYIASEWVPPKLRSVVLPPDDSSRDKKVRPRITPNTNTGSQRVAGGGSAGGSMPPPVSAEAQLRAEGSQPPKNVQPAAPPTSKPAAEVDLLGLDAPVAVAATPSSDDLFTDFLSSTSAGPAPVGGAPVNPAHPHTGGGASELSDAGLFNGEEKKTSTKDAIMALYGPSAPGPGGPYMAPNQAMMNMMGAPNNAMIGMVPPQPGMQVVGGMPMQRFFTFTQQAPGKGLLIKNKFALNEIKQIQKIVNKSAECVNKYDAERPMMMMARPQGAGGMMMPQQQVQYMGQHGGMMGVAPQQQYAMPPQQQQQQMYNMQQMQNQMGGMTLMGDPMGGMGVHPGAAAGMPLGGPVAPGMPDGQGWGQHGPMGTYPVQAAAMGNVWQ